MSEAKKRKKAYYTQSSKRNKSNGCQLDAGMRGFLITCNNNEKRAVQEAYNVLNEYADAMYGPEESTNENDATLSDEDMEKAVNKEVEAMSRTNKSIRRFQAAATKTTNCIFIRTSLDRPDELASKMFLDVATTHESKSRFILKLFPVMGTCRAAEDKIEKLAEEVMRTFVKSDDENATYATIYKVRCNNLGRDAILPLIGTVMLRLNPKIRVNFTEPDFVVSVDVLQKICCISVLRNFYRYRKYNIQELACQHMKPVAEKSASGGVGGSGNDTDISKDDGSVSMDKQTDDAVVRSDSNSEEINSSVMAAESVDNPLPIVDDRPESDDNTTKEINSESRLVDSLAV